MAFSIWLDSDGRCDKCNKDTDEKIISLVQKTRNEKHVIWIHMSCLLKALERAK